MISISRAIKDINPKAEFAIDGTDIDNINWLNGTTPISVTDIQARQTLMETRDAHIVPRQMAYPTIQEQLDSLYKDIVAGTVTTSGAFATAIKAVKDKYPKG